MPAISALKVAGKKKSSIREGAHGYQFDAGWGVTPAVLYVPAAEDWPVVTPSWMQQRRQEIVSRLIESSQADVVEEAPSGPREWEWRVVSP